MIDQAVLDLDVSDQALAAYHGHLDTGEQTRAARFRYDRDRRRFVARRGMLREQLGRALGCAPHAVRIGADSSGKPFLPDDPDLNFNLSHSNGVALCVTARGVRVGCDIEWRNPALACARVAERLFAPDENAALSALPAAHWVQGFFNCWTRKEAYVKALGVGLPYPLDAFSVTVAPDRPAQFLRAEPGWALSSFEPMPGYQAALVTSLVG